MIIKLNLSVSSKQNFEQIFGFASSIEYMQQLLRLLNLVVVLS